MLKGKGYNSVISYIGVPRVRNDQCKQCQARLYLRQQPQKGEKGVTKLSFIYTIILLKSVCLSVSVCLYGCLYVCLSMLANRRSQFLPIVSGDVSNCSYRLSRVRVSERPRILCTRKTPKTTIEYRVACATVYLNEAATGY